MFCFEYERNPSSGLRDIDDLRSGVKYNGIQWFCLYCALFTIVLDSGCLLGDPGAHRTVRIANAAVLCCK